jgi:hypothetical protein
MENLLKYRQFLDKELETNYHEVERLMLQRDLLLHKRRLLNEELQRLESEEYENFGL